MMFRRKKNVIGAVAAEVLRAQTGQRDLDKAVGALLRQKNLAVEEADQFSRTCSDMQTRVEVAQEDLAKRDADLMEHIGKLADAVGMDPAVEPVNEETVMQRIAEQRETSGRVVLFLNVLAGHFDPSEELLRRVSAAMGLCNGEIGDILRHLQQLPELRQQVTALRRKTTEQAARISDLEDDIDEPY